VTRTIAAIAIGVGLSGIAYALAPANPPARTGDTWEYKIVSEEEMAGANNKGRMEQVAEKLAPLGADGWELVTIYRDVGRPDHYFFKRRK
jgi:hypothetical protein